MPSPPDPPRTCDSHTLAHPGPLPLVSPSDLANPMLRVSDAMTAGPRTCSPESTAVEAVLILRDADCGLLPVTADGRYRCGRKKSLPAMRFTWRLTWRRAPGP